MKDYEEYGEELALSGGEESDKMEFEYERIIADTGRVSISIQFMIDGKVKSFHPDDVEVNEDRKTITISEKIAIRRGLV